MKSESEAASPHIQSSEAIVTSQPQFGGQAVTPDGRGVLGKAPKTARAPGTSSDVPACAPSGGAMSVAFYWAAPETFGAKSGAAARASYMLFVHSRLSSC
jgi:hypothetical protein